MANGIPDYALPREEITTKELHKLLIQRIYHEDGVAGAIARFFTVSRVWGNVPGGMIFDFVNKNNLL
jgi:hypothetical protein